MNFEELIGRVGVYPAGFVVGFVSGLVPFVNTEIFLVVVSPFVLRPALAPIALITALGQMVAKSILFYAGKGVFSIKMGRHEKRIKAVQKKFMEREGRADVLIFVSAVLGFPPFYATSFVAGALKLHFVNFLVAGFVGRSIRFGLIIYFPQLLMRIF